ncbi:unnamed protein product [Diamesa serratosioi]
MWTYMMAAARGDRASFNSRQRYNDDLSSSRYVPRFPLYQTTPFTIDPSARSGQTFCERYGVSPPAKSNDTFIYDDGPFVGDTNSGYFQNGDNSKQTTNHMVNLATNTTTNHKQVDSNQQQATVIQFAERDKTSNNTNLIKTSSNNQQPPQYHETSSHQKTPSTFRRSLNAFRSKIITKKGNRKKEPGYDDKNALTTQNNQSSSGNPSDGISSRLSFDPSLPSYYRWLAVVSIAVLYNIIFVVGRAIFWEINRNASYLWYFLDYLCDFIYLVDTLVHAHEGYLEQGLLVRDAKKLRTNFFNRSHWRLDIISMLPTDIIYFWWRPDSCSSVRVPCAVIVRINRLLRLPRMWEWFERTETATGYPNAFRICKVVLAILVLIHWNACLYFAISFSIGFGTDNWVYNLNGPKNSTLMRQYIYSFYWSTLTLTTIGETPTPENDTEYLFVVADFLAGVLIFATIVGNIGSMISNMNVARVEFQNRMDGVKQYMAFRRVGGELEARVIRWFAYTWAQSGALDEERVLAALPDKLKAEIAIRVHMDTLKQVRIFQDCEPGLLEALVLKLRLQVFSPGDYICRKGDVGKEMYIVKRGRLSVVADDGTTVFATLGAGSVFGEVSVLEIAGNRTGNRRTANVRSIGYSDLFCLAKRDLWETLADYPEARASLTERGCQLLRKDGLLDEAVFASATQQQDSLELGFANLENTVEHLNVRLARLLGEYASSQAKLKQRITKLEDRTFLKPFKTVGSNLEHGEDDEELKQRRQGGRLHSLQLNNKIEYNKQDRFKTLNYTPTDMFLLLNAVDSKRIFGIVGGIKTDIQTLPYQLAYLSNGKYRCGASLISNDFALTAGHCLLKYPLKITLRAGSTYKVQGGILIAVKQSYFHPYYVPATFQNDFALLNFDKPIMFSNSIQPVKLPPLNHITYDGTLCTVAGWGKMENKKLSADLKSTYVYIVNQYSCQLDYYTDLVRLVITNEMICSGSYYGGSDACQGDSGSGLVCNGILTGIVSSGYGCGMKSYPGIYARVSAARKWISSISGV